MGGRGSGGHNRLSAEAHILAGTFRKDRHSLTPPSSASAPVADADRRAVAQGLGAVGRRIVNRLLDDYSEWDASTLHTLRQYGISCDRLAALEQDDDGRRREARINMMLLKSMRLDG